MGVNTSGVSVVVSPGQRRGGLALDGQHAQRIEAVEGREVLRATGAERQGEHGQQRRAPRGCPSYVYSWSFSLKRTVKLSWYGVGTPSRVAGSYSSVSAAARAASLNSG